MIFLESRPIYQGWLIPKILYIATINLDLFWIILFSKGIYIKNIYKYPLLSMEEPNGVTTNNWYSKQFNYIKIGNWYLRWLR